MQTFSQLACSDKEGSAGSVGAYEGAGTEVRTCSGQGAVEGGTLKGGSRGFVIVFAELREAIAVFGVFGDADVAEVAVVAVVVATTAIVNHCGCPN